MIYSVHGRLTVKEPNFAVVECAGVGYGCKTSFNTYSALGAIGDEALLYTYLYVREDIVELYGFATLRELSCFRQLITINGVGPKAASTILSDISPEQFAFLVASGDSKAFTKIKGIGAKTAQRIVLELKDKISSKAAAVGFSGTPSGISHIPAAAAASPSVSEALEALMVLGYSQSEAAPALGQLDSSMSTQDLIKEALRLMASKKL